MPANIEVKIRVQDLAPVREKAAAIAERGPELLPQTDTYFRVGRGRLKLRELPGRAELIAYDRPDDHGLRTSRYVVTPVPRPQALLESLSPMLGVRGRVVKRRELWIVGRTRIHLDEVEGLGSFVELEVVMAEQDDPEAGGREAASILTSLDLAGAPTIAGSYIDMIDVGPDADEPPVAGSGGGDESAR